MKKDNFFPMISLEIGTKIAFTSTDIFPATMHYKNTKTIVLIYRELHLINK
jgi:hypothetical protein